MVENYFDKYHFVNILIIHVDLGNSKNLAKNNVSQKKLMFFFKTMGGGLTSVVQIYFDKGV